MQNMTNTNKDGEIEPIALYLGSMSNETRENIKKEVTEFNQMIDYYINHGQQYMYVTAEENGAISYDGLMLLEAISNQAKKEIKLRNAKTNAEKARVIEHVVSYTFKDIVHFDDDDFYTSSNINLIEALNARRGSCCHFAALTHYLHLRNGMYSDLIYSRVDVESKLPGELYHVFNLLFLDDEEKWTFVDTMWEKQFLRIREKNRFSFVSLDDIQSDPYDGYGAHMHIEQDLSSNSIVSIDIEDIDKRLGYQNKICLYQFVYFIAYYIKYGNIDKVRNIFDPRDPNVLNLLNKNPSIQFLGFIIYISALELGDTGLGDVAKRPDETARIYCLDTYLKEILPTLYITFFKDRIKQTNPDVLNDYNSRVRYVSSLFEIIKTKDGRIGVHFDDTIDKSYLSLGFDAENGLPFVEVLNSIQFGEEFGITDNTSSLPNREIAD